MRQVVDLIASLESSPDYHLSQDCLRRVENGQTDLRQRQLLALARAFQVDEFAILVLPRLDEYDACRPASVDFQELTAIGKEAFEVGDYGQSFAAYEKAGEVAADLPDRLWARYKEATAVSQLGMLTLARWKYERLLSEIRADRKVKGYVHTAMAGLYANMENLEMGLAHIERAERLADSEDLNLRWGISNSKGSILADYHELHPDHPLPPLREGHACFEQSLEAARAAGKVRYEASALEGLGRTRCLEGEFEQGRPLLEQALELADESGDQWLVAAVEVEAGRAHLRHGDADTARRLLLRGLKRAQQGGYHEWVVYVCILLIEIERVAGKPVMFYKKLFDQHRGFVERRFPELVQYEDRGQHHA